MDDDQLLRYSRQIMLPEIEIEGQEKLLAASVLVIGMGGLGCPVAMYLAASGVGHLILADDDEVDLSNLQRQIAHTTADIGRAKVASAAEAVQALNEGTRVTQVESRLAGEELARRVSEADVVVDASDNFATRFAVNDACFASGTPLVSGAAIQLEGQISVFHPGIAESPCYRCLYQGAEEMQLSCAENGVAAPVVGMVGTVQALETMKLIVGIGESLVGYLLVLDAKAMEWRKLRLPRNNDCPVCSKRK